MPPWGVAMGCGLGVPCIAAESRVRATVLGLHGSTALAGDRGADHRADAVSGLVGR